MASGDAAIIRVDAQAAAQRAARAEQEARNSNSGKPTGRGSTNTTKVRGT